MSAFLAIYWPVVAVGFVIGIVAGTLAFRPRPKKKD